MTYKILSSLEDGLVITSVGNMIPMAKRVVEILKDRSIAVEFQQLEVKAFPYPETWVELERNVRGKAAFHFQPYDHSPNENFMVMQLVFDALYRSRAKSITGFTGFLPYTRQDRVQAREPFSAKLIASMIEVNPIIDQLVTFDLHVPQIAGFFNKIHVENIPGHALAAPYIRQAFASILHELTIVSTDVGGVARARELANRLGVGLAIIDKQHDKNGSKALNLIGKITTNNIIYDDIADTSGSLVSAAELLRANGSQNEWAYVTHALLSKRDGIAAEKRLRDARLKLIATNTFPRDEAYLKTHREYFTMVHADGLMADLMMALITVNGSVKKTIKDWTARTSVM